MQFPSGMPGPSTIQAMMEIADEECRERERGEVPGQLAVAERELKMLVASESHQTFSLHQH